MLNKEPPLFCSFLVVLALMIPFPVKAKDKSPKLYHEATLKEIKETREPQTVYRQVKQADGSTLNLPQTEYQKVYHFKITMGDEIMVGRWRPAFSFQKPPDWAIGQKVEVRIQKNHLWIKKSSGKELKTKIEERSQLE